MPGSGASRRIAVVGAGAGGLSAARHLLESGHDVTVFEKGSYVGGLWVYDNDNGQSVAYESLHINSEPRVTAFRDHPFPPGTPLFPSHRHVASYLEAFADECGIRQRIRFKTTVTRVAPADGGWTVASGDGEEETFDAVVVAPGHQGVPRHPDWAPAFEGEYRHSHSYRRPHEFAGKRVLVVGAGNSALDIASDLAPFAASTTCAARSPVLVMPRMILGVPTPRVLGKLVRPWMPWPVQRRIMGAVSRVYHGRMEQWGLRTPKTRTHPASHPTFMAHVAYQQIAVKPGVREICGRTAVFVDGSRLEVDVVIAATGYRIDLPFLDPAIAPVRDGHLEAYRRVVHPDRPGLYFVGFFNVSGGANISMMDVQSQYLTALVDGTATLPSPAAMRADMAVEQAFVARNFPGSARYGLELDPVRYRAKMAQSMMAQSMAGAR